MYARLLLFSCFNSFKGPIVILRRDGRVDEGDGLENRCPPMADRGFESHSLRHDHDYPSRDC